MSRLDRPRVQAARNGDGQLAAAPPPTVRPEAATRELAAPARSAGGAEAASAEVLELLAWVARGPRSYAEAMAVWQTSCPRHSVWEDACGDGLIQVHTGSGTTMEGVPGRSHAPRPCCAGRAILTT